MYTKDNNRGLQKKKESRPSPEFSTRSTFPLTSWNLSKAFVCNSPSSFIRCGVILFLRPSSRTPRYPFLKPIDLPPLRIPFIRASRVPLNGTPGTPTIPSQPLDAQRISRPRNLAIITYAAPNKSGGSKPETKGEGALSGMRHRELRGFPLFEPCAKSVQICLTQNSRQLANSYNELLE